MTATYPAVPERQGTADLTALADVLARAQAEGHGITVVYAPTSITHTTTAPAPVPVGSALPARVGAPMGHPGIDIDATGYGYVPPVYAAPLPPVIERREWAPLAFLLSGWGFVGAACAAALTEGNPAAVAALVLTFAASGASGIALYRSRS